MIIRIFAIFLLFVTINAQNKNEYYIGAVVDYAPTYDEAFTPGKNIQQNIDEYEKHIKDAKSESADIILFPEFGLTTDFKGHDILLFTTVLPEPEDKIVACDLKKDWTLVVQRLSCAAKDNEIYVAVNLPERKQFPSEKKQLFFSTTVVFDRNGTLIARYRKYNMNENFFNTTEKPDLTSFETDFNVTFGTFATFDLFFSQPALQLLRENERVTDILYSTSWKSELPFLTGVQMQAGWARANGVNFLAASYSDLQNNNGGSGIYQANGDIFYHVPVRKESKLIVKKIKKISQRSKPESLNNGTVNTSKVEARNSESDTFLRTLKEDMSRYKTDLINRNMENHEICHNNLCCTFTLKFLPQEKEDYHYRTIVYDGPRNFTHSNFNVQICGIAACTNENISSCGDLNLTPSNSRLFDEICIQSTSFLDEGHSVIIPTNVLYNLDILSPSSFIFKSTRNDCYQHITMRTTKAIREILGFGIYSLTQDSQLGHRGLSGGVIAVIVIVVLLAVVIIAFFIWRRFNRQKYNHRVTN